VAVPFVAGTGASKMCSMTFSWKHIMSNAAFYAQPRWIDMYEVNNSSQTKKIIATKLLLNKLLVCTMKTSMRIFFMHTRIKDGFSSQDTQ
jgi:hypothetical protein